MRRPATTLLAGTLAAILPFAAVATSQAQTVLNEQVQLGDVFAEQTLDVVVAADSTTATTTATGNSYDATVDGGNLDIRSTQTMSGSATANTNVTGGSDLGDNVAITSAATGNAGDAGVYGGILTGVFTQTTNGAAIRSNTYIDAPGAIAGDVGAASQAVGNSQGIGLTGAGTGARITQRNSATVEALGGASMASVNGTGNFTSSAAANNATTAGVPGAQRVISTQTNTGATVEAGQFTEFGTASLANTQATATGNNLSAANEQGLLDVTSTQANSADIITQAETAVDAYGGVSVNAYGVGNSLLAGNFGPEVIVDNTQTNDGGTVDSMATFTGGSGYDVSVSATAMGNAATGYACTLCDGRLTATNRQTNSSTVSAGTNLTNSGYSRNITGVSTAVGNSGSYYVSRPSN